MKSLICRALKHREIRINNVSVCWRCWDRLDIPGVHGWKAGLAREHTWYLQADGNHAMVCRLSDAAVRVEYMPGVTYPYKLTMFIADIVMDTASFSSEYGARSRGRKFIRRQHTVKDSNIADQLSMRRKI